MVGENLEISEDSLHWMEEYQCRINLPILTFDSQIQQTIAQTLLYLLGFAKTSSSLPLEYLRTLEHLSSHFPPMKGSLHD